MDTAMHSARLAAAQGALLVLLIEQMEGMPQVDGVTVCLSFDKHDFSISTDITYTSGGMPVGGEGM